MGNCCGRPAPDENKLIWERSRRMRNWQATGTIGLRDAKLKDWPPELADNSPLAASVRVIDLSGNRLTSVPGWLARYTALQRLALSRNALAALPPALCGLRGLRVLLLDGNPLEELPEAIGQLSQLERLDASGSRLARLPPGLGRLAGLRLLNLSRSRLAALPPALAGCVALEELDARDCQLEAVPAELARLPRLRALLLDGNRIAAVPPALLRDAPALATLSLRGNPIDAAALEATEGYAQFEARRRGRDSKAIGAGVMLGPRALDEGVDRPLSPRRQA